MSFKVCPSCGRQNSPHARWCVSCKTPFAASQGGDVATPLDARTLAPEPSPEHPDAQRTVGLGLALGIVLLPYIFCWLTLRRGHSTLSRVLSFGWAGLIVVVAVQGNTPERRAAREATASAQTGQRDWRAEVKSGCVRTNGATMGMHADKVCQCAADRVASDFTAEELAQWVDHVERYGVGPMQSKEKYKGILMQCIFTHHPRGHEYIVEDGKQRR